MRELLKRMTALAGISAVALLAGACATTMTADKEPASVPGLVTAYSGMTLKHARFEMHRQGRTVRTIGFGKDETAWDYEKTQNYGGYLEIQFGREVNGVHSLYVGGGKDRKEKDSAWEVTTKMMPLVGAGKMFALDIGVCADFPIYGASASVSCGAYRCQINWFDAQGKFIRSTPCAVWSYRPTFQNAQTIGSIPNGAAKFSICLGFDGPNVLPGTFCAFSGITLAVLDDASHYVPQSWFELAPMRLDDSRIAWNAVSPSGTAVKLQIAEAEDVNGLPGQWSDFHGPDGSGMSYFTAPFKTSGKWAKVKVFLQASGTDCPALNSLTVNGQPMTLWAMYRDDVEPLIENLTVSPTHNRREDIILRISCMSPILWQSFTAKIDGEEATSQFTRQGSLMVGKPAREFTDGLHKIEVSVKSAAGKDATCVKYLLIGDNPVGVPHVTLRDDGMTLIDSKPVFLIGTYGVWKREFNNNDFDKAFKDLSEAGFNFAQTYNSGWEYRHFLDAAQKHGVYVWARANDILNRDFNELRLKHPAIIAWYTADDTHVNTTINQLQDRHDAMKAVDDHRLTTQADPIYSLQTATNYHDYVRGSDNFLPEIYPVHDDIPEDRSKCVAEVIRDMKASVADSDTCGLRRPRSIWPIIQYFQGWNSWKRFPEENEIRAMSFASVIHGATGITWYTYGGYYDPKTKRSDYGLTSTPERWRIITTITRQLRELSPVLVERTPKEQPVPRVVAGPELDVMGQPSVTCLLKKHEGETTILAVNATLDTVTAEIPVSGINGGSVMFEDRMAPWKDGKLTDTFKPYDVHIYRLK